MAAIAAEHVQLQVPVDEVFWRPLAEAIAPRLAAGAIEVLLSDTLRSAAGAVHGSADSQLPAGEHAHVKHAHERYELCWVVDGACQLWLADQLIPLSPWRACVIRPGEVHQLRSTPGMHPFRVIWWHLVDRGILLHHAAFGGRQEVRTAIFVALAADALQRIDVAVHELEARRPHHELVVRAVLLEVTARVLRALREFGAGDAPPPSRALRPNWYVQRVIDYAQTHHGSEVKLPEIARSVGLSPYYLTTLFRRYTGHTVMDYVGEVRVRAALALLRNTELSVTEVAQRAGYADPYYFMRVFKAREGCSPQAYRRLFQAAAEAR